LISFGQKPPQDDRIWAVASGPGVDLFSGMPQSRAGQPAASLRFVDSAWLPRWGKHVDRGVADSGRLPITDYRLPAQTRKHFDVNGGQSFLRVAERLKAGVAQVQAKLILRLRMEAAMTLAASGICRSLDLFLNVNFWVNLKLNHEGPGIEEGHESCQSETSTAVEIQELTCEQTRRMSDLAQRLRENSPRTPVAESLRRRQRICALRRDSNACSGQKRRHRSSCSYNSSASRIGFSSRSGA